LTGTIDQIRKEEDLGNTTKVNSNSEKAAEKLKNVIAGKFKYRQIEHHQSAESQAQTKEARSTCT